MTDKNNFFLFAIASENTTFTRLSKKMLKNALKKWRLYTVCFRVGENRIFWENVRIEGYAINAVKLSGKTQWLQNF